jgi:hypothetical protein
MLSEDFRNREGSIEFDVLTDDAAIAAYVAMWLRETLPGAFIPSEPDPAPSDDAEHAHRLHCGAWMRDRSAPQMSREVATAFERFGVEGNCDPARVRAIFPRDLVAAGAA